jgi:OOP family OmpA-OmpF porin
MSKQSGFGIAAIAMSLLVACASQSPAPQPAPAPAEPAKSEPAPVAAPAQAAPAPAAAPTAARRCDASVTLQNDETFAFNKSEVNKAARARLDRDVIGKLAACARIESIVIEGHADRIGSQQYNQKLSERRADAVKAYLVSKGTPRDKIETIGMGKTVPARFCPAIKKRAELIACLAPNRRAIVSIKGSAR